MSDQEWVLPTYNEDLTNVKTPTNKSPESFKVPDFVNDIGPGEALAIGGGRGMDKAYRGIKELLLRGRNMLGTTTDQQLDDYVQETKEKDKHWDQGLGNDLAPSHNWGRVGEFGGQVVPGVLIPGGGQTMMGRAGLQAIYNGLYEGATTSGGAGDRISSSLLGAAGGGLGSLGVDSVIKPLAGKMGSWFSDVAQDANLKATEKGFMPSIGELTEKVRRSLGVDDFAKTKPNRIASIEDAVSNSTGSQHRVDIEARKLKRDLGITEDISTSQVLPKVDADNLSKQVSERSKEIWKPFNSAVKKVKPGKDGQVYPLELWNSLQDLAKHNSKILGDSSAIPDDVVRGQLNDLLSITNPNQLKRISADQYSKIVSELSNAQHRTSILSGGQTPTYDAASVARITDAFAKSKNDMAMWGKKNPAAYSAWENALKSHQDEIVPIRSNPVFTTASNLNKHGRDVTKLAERVVDPKQKDYVTDLLRQYKKFGMDDAFDRLNNMDTLRHATSAIGGVKNKGASQHLGSKLGLMIESQSRKPFAKNAYFGDPHAFGKLLRQAPISGSREFGKEELTIAAMLKDIFGTSSDEEADIQGSHSGMSPGALSNVGVQR